MKKIIFSILLILFAAPLISACSNSCSSPPAGYCSVYYYIDGEEFSATYSKYGETIGMPVIEEREGYIFKGWYLTDEFVEKWDFENDTLKAFLRLYGYWIPENEETFNILFYNNQLLSYQKVPKGGTASYYSPSEKKGYEFEGWFCQNLKFDFSAEIADDIILTAKYQVIDYSVTFIAGVEIIEVVKYNIENKSITVPKIPPKEFYTAEWQKFELNLEDIEVEAIYTPIKYTATFIADGKTIKQIKYTVEDTVTIPAVPEKIGYNGSWVGLPIEGGDITITAIYTPIVYTITYRTDDSIYQILEYTVESLKDLVPPSVPEKVGRIGFWEDKTFEYGNVVINAIYEPIIYTATFVADSSIIGTVSFRYDDMNISGKEPDIPPKEGYTAEWESYNLTYEDITIVAEYTPITYTANYYINDQLIGTAHFTIEDESIEIPEIYEWQGYYVSWEDIEISAHDININAKLTPITYYVTFIADDVEIAKIEYNVENKEITVPTPPPKANHTVKWEDFILTTGNITVYAIYTPVSDEELKFKDEFTYFLEDDGSLVITGYTGDEKYLYIPSKHEGKPIKSIDKLAFSGSDITGIKFNEGIEIIGDDAFLNCINLIEVLLPQSLISIGKNSFAYCSFTNIELPNSITDIGENAFQHSALESVILPKNLGELKNSFSYCEKLESITLNEKLTKLKANIFEYCTSLKSIVIPANIELIEANAFANTNLESAYFEDFENWKIYRASGAEMPNVDYSSLSNPETAAYWLTIKYISRVWKKST